MDKGFGNYVGGTPPRIIQLRKRIRGLTDADSMMMEILNVFRETEFIPKVGRYYTFVYLAKTPNLRFDVHPLIACTEVQRWGFKGFNFHWNEMRNYTWMEVAGPLHIVRNEEISYMREIPYARFLTK